MLLCLNGGKSLLPGSQKSGGKSETGKNYNSAFRNEIWAITYTFVHGMYLWLRKLFYRLHTEATGEVMLLNVGGNAECPVWKLKIFILSHIVVIVCKCNLIFGI